MTSKSRKAKGRVFQTYVAERISAICGGRILAEPPTRPGGRANGAVYVPEGSLGSPDSGATIFVRGMGRAGTDVRVSPGVIGGTGRTYGLAIECKRYADFQLWREMGGAAPSAWLRAAWDQACAGAGVAGPAPALVVAGARSPAVIFLRHDSPEGLWPLTQVCGFIGGEEVVATDFMQWLGMCGAAKEKS